MLQLDKHANRREEKKKGSSFCTVSMQLILINGSVLNFAAVQRGLSIVVLCRPKMITYFSGD